MEKIKQETFSEYLGKLKVAAATLTPDQIAACAWVMGTSEGGWNKDNIIAELTSDKDFEDCHKERI